MTKLRKQRRKKVYKYNVNRKRLRNKLHSVGKVRCKELREAWDQNKSVQSNLRQMGLAYNPNKTLEIPNYKKQLKLSNTKEDEQIEDVPEETKPSKAFVVENLEREAKAPREKMFRLPKKQVEWITYLLDKYGTDYKAMVRDKRNVYQETWKQLRAKIKRFISIPEHYSKYLEDRNLTSIEVNNGDEESDGSE